MGRNIFDILYLAWSWSELLAVVTYLDTTSSVRLFGYCFLICSSKQASKQASHLQVVRSSRDVPSTVSRDQKSFSLFIFFFFVSGHLVVILGLVFTCFLPFLPRCLSAG